ncbi:MAG: hypothetical protein IT207_05465 [Fimbriimonadaceae bacterium]|nr:hypothetical protein [Fimbriimonadaceae bacterium]
MQPLLFLFSRSLLNGIRRTLSSPGRLIGVLFLFGYQFFLFGRFLFRGSSKGPSDGTTPPGLEIPAVPLATVSAVLFLLFVAVVVFNTISLGGFRATFRAADADMLYPTPVSARIVVAWRIIGDTLIRLLLPIFLSVLAFAGAGRSVRGVAGRLHDIDALGSTLRLTVIGYLLIAVCFAVFGWGVSLWSYRKAGTDENPLRWIWVAQTAYIVIGAAAFGVFVVRAPSWERLVGFANHPATRAYFFPAHLAERFALGPYSADWASLGLGLAGLLAAAAAGWSLAMRNAPYLYDQAATRAYQVTLQTDRIKTQGAHFSSALDRATRGRLGLGRTALFFRLRAEGVRALLWKELILGVRLGTAQAIIVTLCVGAALVGLSYLEGRAPTAVAAILCALAPQLTSPAARTTVLPEALSRIDLVKPLPFPSWQLLAWDSVSRGLLPCVATLPLPILGWAMGLARFELLVLAWLTGCVLFVTMLLGYLPAAIAMPDAKDPAQAGIRGLASLVVLGPIGVCAIGPPVLAAFLKQPVWAGLVVSILLLLGAGAAAAWLSGRMYDSFNPADP